jgi:hypothetical protein
MTQNNFNNLRRKALFSAALILMLTLPLFAMPSASASNPPISIPTYAYLAVTPNPVGIGQTIFLVMWLHAAPPTAAGNAGDRWHDFTIDVTKPDGTTQKLGPFTSDPTGSTYTLYTPDQLGTYTFLFKYSGQVLSLNNPTNGLPGTSSPYINDTWLPSSVSVPLTVQQTPITPVEEYPLPTEYWTRPISGDNVKWSSLASNWLGSAQIGGYNLWQTGTGPNTSHIMWAESLEFGGVVGGTWTYNNGYMGTDIPDVGYYSGGSYEGRFASAISMWGYVFYPEPLGHSGTGGGYTCRDMRTGEIIWHRDDINVIGATLPTPTFGQLFDYESPNQHGVVGGLLWTGNLAYAYDAFTGKLVLNLTGVPSGTEVYTNKGEIVRYVLNYNTTSKTGSLALWNNTQDRVGLHLSNDTGTNAWQWRPNGKYLNLSTAYSWNVSITADLTGNSAPAIVQVLPGDIILGRSSAVAPGVGDKFTPDPFTLWAISDKPGSRGQLLWKQSYAAPPGNTTRRFNTVAIDPINRVFVMSDVETMQWIGYNLDTGSLVWGPTNVNFRAYQYYGSGEGGGQRASFAYGNLYVQGFGGEIFCFDTKNGNLLWRFSNTNSGLDTPWGLRPIFLAAIADGKIYVFNNEHSPNQPLYRGNKIYCLDAFTGKEIYSMLSWSGQTGGQGRSTAILADGFLMYYNYYDGRIYSIGKGPSATTVEAPLTAVAKGQSVMIKGTVTDQSAGAKGTPAIADESMSAWMEYTYMQKPKPTNATGVQVKLTAVDPNGNTVDIATVTSDTSGLYYYKWTPTLEGAYKVIATFAGSGSYWPSSAETAVGVDPAAAAPTSTPTTEPTVAPTVAPTATASPSPVPNTGSGLGTEVYIAIAAAAVIAIVAAAALILRKRK